MTPSLRATDWGVSAFRFGLFFFFGMLMQLNRASVSKTAMKAKTWTLSRSVRRVRYMRTRYTPYVYSYTIMCMHIYTPRYNHIHISWNVHHYIQLYAYIHIYVFGMPRLVIVSMHPLTYTYICTYPYSIIAGMYLRSIYIYIYTYYIPTYTHMILPKHVR